MTEQSYRAAFEQAKKDLASALATEEAASKAAAESKADSIRLRRAVTALAALCGENIEDSMGLTEAVRAVFQATNGWRSLAGVKEHVEALGASLGHLKNPDASVLSVLNRLVNAGELQMGSSRQKTGSGFSEIKIWKLAPSRDSDATPLTDDDIPF